MTNFILFAARDGEAIVQLKTCLDLEAAECWAFDTVKSHFEIETEFLEGFSEIVSETDGMILMDFEKLVQFSLLNNDSSESSLILE